MRIAIQGQAGSFHEQAAHKQYGSDIEIVPCDTFGDVFRTYREGKADAIVVAVENTIHGTINEPTGKLKAVQPLLPVKSRYALAKI